jgi:hypothetical protein
MSSFFMSGAKQRAAFELQKQELNRQDIFDVIRGTLYKMHGPPAALKDTGFKSKKDPTCWGRLRYDQRLQLPIFLCTEGKFRL